MPASPNTPASAPSHISGDATLSAPELDPPVLLAPAPDAVPVPDEPDEPDEVLAALLPFALTSTLLLTAKALMELISK